MKSFSVVLTYYKRPELLSRALHCLRQQTYQNFEVIPIFDGGVDYQASYIYEQFRARVGDFERYKDIVLYTQGNPKHFGNDARHHAMRYCHEDYVIWYGHDCIIDRDFLETHAEQIQDDWCISVVGQAHFTWHDHQDKWLTFREDLPRTSNPDVLAMEGLDLLNFALPTHLAEKWAWTERLRDRYEADWFTFRDVRNKSGVPVRINPKVVCAHF